MKRSFSPYRYPGGKSKYCNEILQKLSIYLDKNNNFVDVFVGGGSITLAVAEKYRYHNIYINDIDPWVYSFWKLIAKNDSKEIKELFNLIDIKPTIDYFNHLREKNPQNEIEQAYYSIFFNRTTFSGLGFNGPIGGKDQKSKYTIDCRYNSLKIKSNILECIKLLSGRTIVSNNHFSNFNTWSNTQYVSYLDPPYVEAGKQLYTYWMQKEEHILLSNILQVKNDWVLSYDDDELIRDLYKNNQIFNLSVKYSVDGKKTNLKNKNELLITK